MINLKHDKKMENNFIGNIIDYNTIIYNLMILFYNFIILYEK